MYRDVYDGMVFVFLLPHLDTGRRPHQEQLPNGGHHVTACRGGEISTSRTPLLQGH